MQPSNTPEEWRPVVGYEGYYEVSDHGNVRSLDRVVPRGRHTQTVIGRALSPSAKPSGHMQVSIIGADRKQRTRMVHQLVLDAFVGPCPEGMEACHTDDDPTWPDLLLMSKGQNVDIMDAEFAQVDVERMRRLAEHMIRQGM